MTGSLSVEGRVVGMEQHQSDDVTWAFARWLPHQALAADVVGYTAYTEHALKPVRRREVPGPRVPVIISFGDTLQVTGIGVTGAPSSLTSFIGGFHDRHAVTEYVGRQRGLQVDLTPLGAYRLLGLTGDEIRLGSLDLADVLGRPVDRLVDAMVCAPDWFTRFGLADAFFLRCAEGARPVDPAVAWAWSRLHASCGQVPIGALTSEIGWSRRHFVDRFRRHTGQGPKATARVLRFARAAALLDGSHSISDVAATCGYADHSHLVRDVREMAGCSPSELIAERG